MANVKPVKKSSTPLIYVLVVDLLILAVYGYLYYFEPLPEYWNTLILDITSFLMALAAAITGTYLARQFGRGEKPRPVWFWFMLGWWSWVLGEIIGTGYDVFNLTYGEFSYFDIFWTLGYLCFGLALFYQFRVIYRRGKKSSLNNFAIVVAVILLATLGFTYLALAGGLGNGMSFFALYLAIFYPVCDLALGVAALWLSVLIGRGSWARPWWSLIVFAVADGINIFLWIGGDRLLSESAAMYLDWFSSIVYIAGYMAAAFGFLSMLLIHFASLPAQVPTAAEKQA